jgi:23S rRNA pseudouridine2604 synthase
MNINRWLVKQLTISSAEAINLITLNKIFINEKIAIQKQKISSQDTILNGETVLQKAPDYFYLAYHKPRGIECTLNPLIPHNLLTTINFNSKFFPLGRLDKDSEGLMILTNDGLIYNQITNAAAKIEKEYVVAVDGLLTTQHINELSSGIQIMGKITNACVVKQLDDHTFKIILTQGMNRQIRRMCYKLGFQVTSLKRMRIGKIEIGNIAANEYIYIQKSQIL